MIPGQQTESRSELAELIPHVGRRLGGTPTGFGRHGYEVQPIRRIRGAPTEGNLVVPRLTWAGLTVRGK